MTILLVDDNKVNLFVIEKILNSEGYHDCMSLTSAHELFDYLQLDAPKSYAKHVDLILLDIMMPEIDGIEACKVIKANDRYKDIPIIFVTALDDKNKLAQALDLGGIDYITKPIDKVELVARIRVALRLKAELDWHTQHEKKIQYELDLATNVQRSLLSPPLRENNLQVEVSYLPSFNLAGDMYYWHKINDHRYAVILLDMMGHGISASLLCMFISSVLREAIKQIIDPADVVKELNRYMAQLHNEKESIPYYFTAIYLVIDTEQKTIEYVNAGHPHGYVNVDGENIVPLNQGSCAIGFFEDIKVEKQIIRYEKEAQIILFTDGLLEAVTPNEFEAEERIKNLAQQKWNCSQKLLDALIPKEKQSNQPDDMCLVLLKVQG